MIKIEIKKIKMIISGFLLSNFLKKNAKNKDNKKEIKIDTKKSTM